MSPKASERRREPATHAPTAADRVLHARRIVGVYHTLSKRHAHLLAPVIGNARPTQWVHYPQEDALDARRRFQWYYHSHSPADRPNAVEHGHFHVFARTDARRSRIDPGAEAAFLKRIGAEDSQAKTRHLLAIALSPLGVPISLFTVNRWVTGDQLLSSDSSLRLLQTMTLDTGHQLIDRLISSLIRLCQAQVRSLFLKRDRTLFARARRGSGALDDPSIEVLSACHIDLDRIIASAARSAVRR